MQVFGNGGPLLFLSFQNDINEIPFFDVELPRELALKIFQYLDPRDLCRCCQVLFDLISF